MEDATPSSSSHVEAAQVEYAFPTPPRATTPDPSYRVNGRHSPATGKFMSFQRAQSTPPELSNGDNCPAICRGTVGSLPTASNLEEPWQRLQLSKKTSQYYSDAFAYRGPSNTAKDRVIRDSVVMAEVKLNCCVDSEQELLIDLSFRLSEIYQRPASCIMVMLATEISVLVGGSSEPAYFMTVTALPAEIAATKNKRSAHLIQQFMQDALKISPRRGILRFDAVAEENLATNGVTALQEIEQLQRDSGEGDSIWRTIGRQKSKRSKKSSNPFSTESGKPPTPAPRATTPSPFPFKVHGTRDSKSTEASGPGRKRVKHRKSILAFFRR